VTYRMEPLTMTLINLQIHWPILEFYTPRNMSERAKARDFKFCIQVDHVKY